MNRFGPGRWGYSVTASSEGLSNDRCTDRRVHWVGTSGVEGDGLVSATAASLRSEVSAEGSA